MTKARRIQFPCSALIIGWILSSLSLSIAFLPHNLPAQNSVSVPMSIPMSLSAVDASATMEGDVKPAAEEESVNNQSMIHRYDSPFFPISSDGQRIPSALIILNTPIKSSYDNGRLSGVLGKLWDASSYRICADGGANRLYDATVAIQGMRSETDSSNYLPDLITGDLDSLRSDVHQYYEAKGVSIIRVEDQNFHDLDVRIFHSLDSAFSKVISPNSIILNFSHEQKSLMAVENWVEKAASERKAGNDDEKTNTSRTFIYGGFGGRFDQEMGCINALCVWGKKESFQQTSLALYDEETCAFALPESPMKSEVRIRFPGESIESEEQTNLVGEGPTCGLIPIFGRCEKVMTTGLKWNLEGDTPIEFGGIVSSSNRAIDEVVTVETSCPMIFTAEMIVKQE